MPLVPYNMRVIRKLLHRADKDPDRRGRVLGLSCPDVIALPVDARRLFEVPDGFSLPVREDSPHIVAFHKAHHYTREVVHTADLFRSAGYEFKSFDITAGRACEEIHDLNEPLPPRHPFIGACDLVFDICSNQVFNVAQAMWTAAQCCRVGGFVVHCIQMSMVNQGFWAVSPTAYRDFYPANGFELEVVEAVDGMYVDAGRVEVHPVNRTRNVPPDAVNLVVARKVERRGGPTWPVMTKFRNNPYCYR